LRLDGLSELSRVGIKHNEVTIDLKSIPLLSNALELMQWAEQRERSVYAALDGMGEARLKDLPVDIRFEGILWLQGAQFFIEGKQVAPKRLLMIDDLHKLRRKQRKLLVEETTELRPNYPIWLAERNIALGDELLSQGVRQGRDIREYSLEQLWSGPGGQQQFVNYAKNILDRRLETQSEIPAGAFVQYLSNTTVADDIRIALEKGSTAMAEYARHYSSTVLYRDWAKQAERVLHDGTVESLRDFYVTKILISRDEARRQMTLELDPLPAAELQARESPQIQSAADIFMNDELEIPYYFGIDLICSMATSNVEELLSLAAAVYDGVVAKQVLRRPELLLSPAEQEKLLKDAAKRKHDFIPKSHTEGTRAQKLLDSIGVFCRDRTFLPTAPYAPGVTGVRLSQPELIKLDTLPKGLSDRLLQLKKVLAECVAENLLVTRSSAPTVGREGGTVFYLNRTLCVHHGLPLQFGGWQDVSVERLIEWMERVPLPSRRQRLEFH
jgi:hypothetical protein